MNALLIRCDEWMNAHQPVSFADHLLFYIDIPRSPSHFLFHPTLGIRLAK